MRKPLEIPVPTAEELTALETLYRTTRDVRLRTRVQIVLLAGEQRMTAPAIARIVREDDQTVRNGIPGTGKRPGASFSNSLRSYQSAWVAPLRLAGSQEAARAIASFADDKCYSSDTWLSVVYHTLSAAFLRLSVVNFVGGPNRPFGADASLPGSF
ncbi:MAG: hypothetical protein ACYDER_24210 [Ktedonobacteraceae bacterium]